MRSAYVGSKERRELRAKRFMQAPAPMTAKSIIRDELTGAGVSEAKADELVATIINRLAAYEYHIEQATD